jgi:uncharacterized OB-fold protein
MAYEKPLPAVNAESRPFWEACKRHQLMLQHCQACGHWVYYPRALCTLCHSDQLAWEPVSGEGAIYSFTVCHRPAGPAFAADAPYVVALIDLREGPRMLSSIVTDDPAAVRIGQAVRVTYDDVTDEITLPRFVVRGQKQSLK